MNIAYMVTRADPIGGAQIHVRDLASALTAWGHATTVITSGTGPFLEDLRAQGIRTVVLQHLTAPIHPLRDLRALYETRSVLRDLRPDLLATHSSKAGIVGRLVARSLGVPVVFTAHGWAFTPGITPAHAAVYRAVERLAGPLTSKIITVSEFDRRLALSARIAPPDRIVTVYNGIRDVPLTRRADPGGSPVRLAMVARFEPQKDHRTLLQALAGLTSRAWELDLIGEGPLRPDMERLVSTLGLTGRVHFLGQRTDVDQLLARAQVSLLISNWEGFPLTVLEAMRARLPVVASAVAGIAEAIRDGESGYLVPRGDALQLQDRIARLLDDPNLRVRMGASGRTRYEQHFTLEHFVSKTLEVYQEVLAGASLPRAELAGSSPG